MTTFLKLEPFLVPSITNQSIAKPLPFITEVLRNLTCASLGGIILSNLVETSVYY